MADYTDTDDMKAAQAALLKAITKMAAEPYPAGAQAARDYAEAFAWLVSPSQPHGGSTSS